MQMDKFSPTTAYPRPPAFPRVDASKTPVGGITAKRESDVALVMAEVLRLGGATTCELASRLKMPYHTIQRRTSIMSKRGRTQDSGMRRKSDLTGKPGMARVAV